MLQLALLVLCSVASARNILPRDSDVGITTLSKSVNTTSGTGEVAAAGTLSPFGGIGVGCGINWAEGVSYGGGLQAGSDLFGLGGGYTITNTSMEIGAGMGFTQLNASASLNFVGYSNGTFEMEFSSSTPFECTQETKDGLQTMRCSYV